MPTVYDNVTFTVGGANPQTKTVQVAFNVNPVTGVGTATASFTFTGTNSGIDTITAALPDFGYTSNAATVAWQACPSLISASNVISVGVIHGGQYHGFPYTSAQAFLYTLTVASFYYNVNPATFNIPGLVTNFDEAQPGVFVNITAQGTYAGTTTPLQNATATVKDGGNTIFQMVMRGSFVVKQAGNYLLNAFVDDSFLLAIGGGASRVAGTGQLYNPYGQTVGP